MCGPTARVERGGTREDALATPVLPLLCPVCCRAHASALPHRYIFNLKSGESLNFKGPFPKWPYVANQKKAIGMIAGGTGITPMYQLLRDILSNPRDKTGVFELLLQCCAV